MEFTYPYLTDKKECRGCEDCVKACSAEAISFDENKEWHVDKEKCSKYQEKIEDICMNCIQYCRKKVIQLREGT